MKWGYQEFPQLLEIQRIINFHKPKGKIPVILIISTEKWIEFTGRNG